MAVKSGEARIMTSLSFSQLEDTLKEKVLACARDCGTETATTWPIDAKQVILNRLDLPGALERAKRFVDEVEPMGFPWIDDNRAAYYEEELSFSFYLALADCELALLDKASGLAGKQDTLLHIGGLLAQLRNRKKTPSDLETNPALAHDLDNPTRYFGLLFIAPKISEAIKKLTIDKLAGQVDYPASLNDGRLYLVWATEMLGNICAIMRRSFRYISFVAMDAFLDAVSFGTGAMGWILYFLRGGVATAFLLEVSDEIKALGLSDQEKSECFIGKWHEKKFLILNDAVWGLVNCICFFVLTGSGMLGWGGNALNGALFIFDFALGAWQLSEAQTAQEALMADYQSDINSLRKKLVQAKHEEALEAFNEGEASKALQDKVIRMTWRLDALKRDKGKAEREWRYQIKQFRMDAMYSGAVILAFAILCCFFVTPGAVAPLTALMFALVGSIMCFGLGIVYAAFSSELSISKTGEDSKAIEEDYQDYLKLFRGAGNNDNLRRTIFLDISRTMANTDYQKQLLQYQRADMVCRIVTDMMLPVLFMAAFVFMPMTMGASVFAVGLVLMITAKCYVANLAPEDVRDESIPLTMLTRFSGFFTGKKPEPKEEEPKYPALPPPFPEKEYQAFCADFDGGASGDALRKHFLPAGEGSTPSNQASGTAYPEPE